MTDNGDDVLIDLHAARGSTADTLDTIIEWARHAVASTDAGIFLLRAKGKVETAVPTSPQVVKSHDLQVELDEGPCIEVVRNDTVNAFVITDTATDGRFPRWGPAAADLGLVSVVSVVLDTRQKRFGSLNVYSREADAFDRHDLDVLEIFSRRAARALAVVEDNVGMTAALDSRKLIGQAEGILMEHFDIDEDHAFEFLLRQSQSENVKLRVIADQIVNRRGDTSLTYLNPDAPPEHRQ